MKWKNIRNDIIGDANSTSQSEWHNAAPNRGISTSLPLPQVPWVPPTFQGFYHYYYHYHYHKSPECLPPFKVNQRAICFPIPFLTMAFKLHIHFQPLHLVASGSWLHLQKLFIMMMIFLMIIILILLLIINIMIRTPLLVLLLVVDLTYTVNSWAGLLMASAYTVIRSIMKVMIWIGWWSWWW